LSKKPTYICISAPSGTGKSTVVNHLLAEMPELGLSISATTRSPRNSEKDGREYFFISDAEFDRAIAAGDMLESEEVFGQRYGTLRSRLDTLLHAGKRILFDIDVNGALRLRDLFGEESLLVFLVPPDKEELIRRLKKRQTESAEKIRQRLQRLPFEMQQKDKFDHIIVNKDINETVALIKKILNEES
jgi:guanylate kinase